MYVSEPLEDLVPLVQVIDVPCLRELLLDLVEVPTPEHFVEERAAEPVTDSPRAISGASTAAHRRAHLAQQHFGAGQEFPKVEVPLGLGRWSQSQKSVLTGSSSAPTIILRCLRGTFGHAQRTLVDVPVPQVTEVPKASRAKRPFESTVGCKVDVQLFAFS